MSLYSDNPTEQDPYQALAVALAKPAETAEQVVALQVVSDLLEEQPAAVQTLCLPLFEHIKNTGDTALKRWVLERIAFGVGRSSLQMESKTAIASTVLSDTVQLLQDSSPAIVKLAVQILSCIYPLLFRSLCLARPPPPDQWPLLTSAKTQILSFALAISIEPETLGQPREVNIGVRAIAWKFVQRALLVATRSGSADPRLQLQNKDDPNLNLVPAVHPYIKTVDLMNETKQFLAQTSQALANSCENCVLHPILNMVPPLLKARPALAASLIPSLTNWTPANMQANGCSASQIRAVEKSLKVAMVHLLRTALFPAFSAQLNDALERQKIRLLVALKAEKVARHEAAARRAQASTSTTAKREHGQVGQASTDGVPSVSKRQRMETPPVKDMPIPFRPGEGLGPDFDVTTINFDIMLELFYITLNGIDERTIRTSIEQTRRRLVGATAPHLLALATSLGQASSSAVPYSNTHTSPAASDATTRAFPSRLQEDEPDDMLLDPLDEDSAIPSAAVVVTKRDPRIKEEDGPAQNPLNMVDEEEEIDPNQEIVIPDVIPEADVLPEETLPMRFVEFSLPEAEALSERDQQATILQIMRRICRTGGDVQHQMADETDTRLLEEDSEATQGLAGPMISPKEMWILLLARMASRSSKPEAGVKAEISHGSDSADSDWIRKALCDYVLEDFAARSKLARVWLNEEWFAEQLVEREENASSYARWLNVLLSRYLGKIEDGDSADTSLSAFLIDLPDVPGEIFNILRGLCETSQSAPNGMSTLRDIVTLRPPLRQAAMGLLLDMTTHPDRKIRLVAINTVKRWVPDTHVMSDMVLAFAQNTFLKLTQSDETEPNLEAVPVAYTYLPKTLPLPANQEIVQQYSELLFALSVRESQLLDQIFAAYPRCEDSVKTALRTISTPLIRSLGSKHARLLESLRNFPTESEPFALHVVTVLTDNARPSPALVDVIKARAEERELSAPFLIPIAAQMNRTELYRFLPTMLGVLNESTVENKETIRNVFRNIIPISDIHASTNLPKSKPEEMSAADLLVLLHEEEKKIGVSAAKDAIDICFTLTDRFPSEVLAVVMQRIIDSVSLPILFMRTVIRSVSTYKSLVGYVSTTLLSRLITKKIWTSPQLWKGFIYCVKALAPASFGALMQLPREQLKELIDKQPSIKPALYQYVVQKAGVAKAQSLADLFGNNPQSPNTAQPISTVT